MSSSTAPKGTMRLSDDDVEFYATQIVMPEIGPTGQARLLSSSVLVVGDGEGARTAARYLRGSGVRVETMGHPPDIPYERGPAAVRYDCVVLPDVDGLTPSMREHAAKAHAPVIWYRARGATIESGIARSVGSIPDAGIPPDPCSPGTPLARVLHRAAGAETATMTVAYLLGWSREDTKLSIVLE